jgi:hypothetical protein
VPCHESNLPSGGPNRESVLATRQSLSASDGNCRASFTNPRSDLPAAALLSNTPASTPAEVRQSGDNAAANRGERMLNGR